MIHSELTTRGLVLLGCGKMGSAMLAGWLDDGLPASAVTILDPNPSDWVTGLGARLNDGLPKNPAVCILAVKPQMMGAALPQVAALAPDTLFISIAAGTTLAALADALGDNARIIRAMPNTPAAIGKGVSIIIGNPTATDVDLALAEDLLAAVGLVDRITDEAQMDAVTALSGSGPAYVFHMIETLAAAGVAEGLPADLAMTMAKATVAGAGSLAMEADESPAQLRINVTSPNGTTQAGLEVLMQPDALPDLIQKTVSAAANRSRELGK